jgi:adenylate cyclase class IV
MTQNHYEIEIKTLPQSKERADALLAKMKELDPNLEDEGTHKQLNHYFKDGDLESLFTHVSPLLNAGEQARFKEITERAKDFSVRTRWADGRVILVVKASVDDTTSSNGTARLEFEAELKNVSLEVLDQTILSSGFHYQAKWSRERSSYKFMNTSVSVDKNAGYGYLAEFEILEKDLEKIDERKATLRHLLKDLGIEELDQERLARMFDFYNANWEDYYGTEKTFNID